MLDGTKKQMTEPLTTAGRLSIVPFEAAGLGDRSYMVHDGAKAAVIDPQRDPAPYIATAADLHLKIEVVLETHIHNDYVSGGVALARRTGATYGVPEGEPVDFAAESRALAEGDMLTVGSLTFRAIWTPGHTPHHLAFLTEDGLGTMAVMTGGSLLAEATGRTDLSGGDQTAELAEAQWHSVRRLLDELPSSTRVLPTHGFGSFCSAGAHQGPGAHDLTVGQERQRNPVTRLGLPAFVESLLHQSLPVPAYYRYMAPLNRAGAAEPQEGIPPTVSSGDLAGLVRTGAVVVDLRGRRAFARDHRRGALNIELGPDLPTYFGWLVPFMAPFVLVSDTAGEILEACHLLSRIGRDNPLGWAPANSLTTAYDQALERYEIRSFAELARRTHEGPQANVLDVRFPYEWRSGHVSGARNVPLPEVALTSQTLSEDEEIWVHCHSGFRAAIAASVLSGAGLFPVLVDDSFENAPASGLVVVAE
jgi:hydroxyacylglutathione hydrolase